ncbi:MAG: thiamine pyrophosphate-dependent enzyme [Thermoplasmata archaeon]|jgi:TPP-dependent pyruvate/acetoin dehydrogenase alpha subunit
MAKATAPKAVDPVATDDFPEDRLLEIYRTEVLARLMDDRCITLQRQGRIGFYVPHSGQEAAQVGCGYALDPGDWLFPAYRELALALVRGVPVKSLLDQFMGNSADLTKGRQMPNHYSFRDQHFVSPSSPIGTQITQAVGAAMAARRRHEPIVTVAFFGDGATSSNDFHAGLNFAGVYDAPTIFFCQNNEWAISLPRQQQTRTATLAEKAAAYGFPGVVVDGNDVRAVFRAVRTARARAIAGHGPTLIEAQVYRFGPHSTSDDPHRYRPEDAVRKAREQDPVLLLQAELIRRGILTDASNAKIWEELKAEVGHAIEAAETTPHLDPLSFFDDVFAQRTPALEEQRASFEQSAREGVQHP